MKTRLSNFLSIFVLSSLILSEAVFAQDISFDSVTATTSLRQWNNFSIEQITDGITADCRPECNGFTTNAKTGRITFNFETPHDIDGIKIWNDVAVRKEGIKDFRLELKTAEGVSTASPEFTAVSGQTDAQYFEFERAENITEVDLIVMSSLLEDGPTPTTRTYRERIEAREVTFAGSPSAMIDDNVNSPRGGASDVAVTGGGNLLNSLLGVGLTILEEELKTNQNNSPKNNEVEEDDEPTVITIDVPPLEPDETPEIIDLPPVIDNPPELSFNPSTLLVNSKATGTSILNALDDFGIVSGPIVQCTDGGSYVGSTFTAPLVRRDGFSSVCTATAMDEVGNVGTAQLRVFIEPLRFRDPLVIEASFKPPSLILASGETGRSVLGLEGHRTRVSRSTVTCTNGGTFSEDLFVAPTVTVPTVSVCNASASDAEFNSGSAQLTVEIMPKEEEILPPVLAFSPSTLNVKAEAKGTSILTGLDDFGFEPDLNVQCTNGGSFIGSTFRAPQTTDDMISVCTATITGAAGPVATAQLQVHVEPMNSINPIGELSFSPNHLKIASGRTGLSTLKLFDYGNDIAINSSNVTCTNGGSFSDDIFVAPKVTVPTVSICTAPPSQEAGYVGTAELRVEIEPEEEVILPPVLAFNPPTLQIRSGENGVSSFTAIDDTGIPSAPFIKCTNGGTFNNPDFTAPNVFEGSTSVCTASVTNGAGIPGKGFLTVTILPPQTAPQLSFNPSVLTLESGESAPLSVLPPEGMVPEVSCTSGTLDGTLFTAPTTKKNMSSQCTAIVTDAAGNKLQSNLSVSVSKPPVRNPPLNPALILLGGLGLLGLGGLIGGLLRPRRKPKLKLLPRHSMRPSKPLERPENGGVVFPGSPMQAANVATPLSPAGQLTASNLQMLNGPFQVLRPAYHATGRIGYAQEGKPTSEDYSFGTGFLISPNHVMTNRHVHGFYGHYLTCDEDCGGIEFVAEKDKDASDFIPFNGQPPLLLEGLDIAIYTLSRSAGNRTPINRVPIPTEDLEGRDIAVVGYPDTHDPNNPDILAVVEDNPIFAVKRISQGKVFRHSTDNDDPYGVEVNVNETDKKKFPMQAICHNASTLGGNSGSPILDLKTGELLGVHFAGHKIFNTKEAANLAMAIAQLTEHSDIKNV